MARQGANAAPAPPARTGPASATVRPSLAVWKAPCVRAAAMLSTVTWIPRGFACANPAAYAGDPAAVDGPEAAALALAQEAVLSSKASEEVHGGVRGILVAGRNRRTVYAGGAPPGPALAR